MLKLASALAVATLLATSCTQSGVRRVDPDIIRNPGRLDASGVFFALPRTVLKVRVPVTRTVSQGSPFLEDLTKASRELEQALKNFQSTLSDEARASLAQVAESAFESPEYLDLLKRLNRLGIQLDRRARTTFELGEVQVRTLSEPDPNQLFVAELDSDFVEDRSLAFDFSPQGVLTAGSIATEDRSFELATAAVAKVAQIAALTSLANWQVDSIDQHPVAKVLTYASELVADLEKLEAQKRSLLTGITGAVDASAMAAQLEILKEREASLRSYFSQTEVEVWTAEYRWTPTDRRLGRVRYDLFGFSEISGIYPVGKGRPSDPEIPRDFVSPVRGEIASIELALPQNPSDFAPLTQVVEKRAKEESGLPYRVPTTATLTVKLGRRELVRGETTIAQFGPVVFLPRTAPGLRNRLEVEYFPETGSIRTVGAVSKGLRTRDVRQIESAVAPLIENSAEIRAGIEALQEEITRGN